MLNFTFLIKAIKILFLSLTLATIARSDSSMSFTVGHERGDIYPNPRFPLMGKFVYINVKELKSGKHSYLLFYLHNDGSKMYCVEKSLQNMNQVMENEFPNGLGVDRANEILKDLLVRRWNSVTEAAPTSWDFEHLWDPDTNPPPRTKETFPLAKELFGMPKIEVRGNQWFTHRIVQNSHSGLSFRKFAGTLKPLMITEYSETILVADKKFEAVEWPWLSWNDDTLRMAIKKKKALLSKHLAEWEIRQAGH